MRVLASALIAGAAMAVPATGQELKAAFIGEGTYATAEGCKKLKALDDGTPRNVETVPETLDADGFHGWEGACTFHSITEKVKGKIWSTNLKCFEGADESTESDIFERLDDNRIKVTIMGEAITFERCQTKEAK